MKVRGGVVRRLFIVGLFLGLSVGACSSSSQQQQETVESQGSQGTSQEGATDQVSNGSGENQANGGEVSPGDGANGAANGADGGGTGNEGTGNGAQAEANGSQQDDSLTGLMNDMNSSIGQSTNPPAESMPDATTGELDAAQPADSTADSMATMPDAAIPEAAPAEPASAKSSQVASEATAAELPEMGAKLAYIIERGDTLAKISQKIFGKSSLWRKLAKASRISNPDKIYPGELVYYQLTKDSLAFATVYESMTKSTVTVSEGDTLAKISKKIYGTTENWRSIWRQNDFVNNPEVLSSGTVIYYLNHSNLVSQVKSLRLKLQAEKTKMDHSLGFQEISSTKGFNKIASKKSNSSKKSVNTDLNLGISKV